MMPYFYILELFLYTFLLRAQEMLMSIRPFICPVQVWLVGAEILSLVPYGVCDLIFLTLSPHPNVQVCHYCKTCFSIIIPSLFCSADCWLVVSDGITLIIKSWLILLIQSGTVASMNRHIQYLNVFQRLHLCCWLCS